MLKLDINLLWTVVNVLVMYAVLRSSCSSLFRT